MTKISILGEAGQGIQLFGRILAEILKDQGFSIAMTYQYDAFVRGGKSDVRLIFSKKRIDNPIVEKADLEYDLKKKKNRAKLVNKYNNPQVVNMVLLGIILKKLKIKLKDKEIKRYLPKKLKKANFKAFKAGYQPK
jgi:Pyruvate/2-oxoacid:ferredoxin oxidoreductase gamma subunit